MGTTARAAEYEAKPAKRLLFLLFLSAGTAAFFGCAVPSTNDRALSRDGMCVANLHHMATAFLIYACDPGDPLPTAKWMDDLEELHKERAFDSFRCTRVAAPGYGYAFNPKLVGAAYDSIPDPTMALVYDTSDLKKNSLSTFVQYPSRHPVGNSVCYVNLECSRRSYL